MKKVGLVGKKRGMTRFFTEAGEAIPVTVIELQPNRVTQTKTLSRDGYHGVQVTMGDAKASNLTKAQRGMFAKASVAAGQGLWEFRLSEESTFQVGDALTLDLFTEGARVDVTACSKGKGFQGVVKRWNFRTQDASHGNSLSHRAPGSIGQCQTPGRVFKGKKMAGQRGNVRVTVQSLEVVRIDSAQHLLVIKGAVPGANGSNVIIRPAAKHCA